MIKNLQELNINLDKSKDLEILKEKLKVSRQNDLSIDGKLVNDLFEKCLKEPSQDVIDYILKKIP